jgi:hypothetical protein
MLGVTLPEDGRLPMRVAERLRGRPAACIRRKETTMNHPTQVRLAGSVLDRFRHVCAFFHNKEEEYRVLLPYIKQGFEQGDRMFHIIDRHRRQEHIRRLQDAGIDTAGAEAEERLVVRHWEDTYLQDGYFDQHRQISLFERVLLEGKERGYPLTRFVAGTEWALLDRPGVHDLIEYECRINNMFNKYDDPSAAPTTCPSSAPPSSWTRCACTRR